MSFSEQVKKQLTECCKEGQHVLLYNDNSKNVFDRRDLVREVHAENSSMLDPPIEFVSNEKELSSEDFKEKIRKPLLKFLNGLSDRREVEVQNRIKQEFGRELGFNVRERGVIRAKRSKSQDQLEPCEIDDEQFNRKKEILFREKLEYPIKELEIINTYPFVFYLNSHETQTLLEQLWSEVGERFRSTTNAFWPIDCASWDGRKVYSSLTKKSFLDHIPILDYLIPILSSLEENHFHHFNAPIFESILFDFRGTVFLNNLRCDSEEDYECYRHLGNIIKNSKMEPGDNLLQHANPINSETQYDVSTNWIVAYTENPGAFPRRFKKPLGPFVEIPLDGDWKKQERGEGKVKTNEATFFPNPQDAKWSDVEITFIDGEHVNIKVKDDIKSGVHYSQMGFKHKTAPKEIKLWETLRLFAIANGIIIPKFDTKGKLVKTVSGDDVKRLRLKLKSYFGISDNPIPPYDKGKYINKKEGGKEHIEGEGYKTIFVIKDDSSLIKQKAEFTDTADVDPDY